MADPPPRDIFRVTTADKSRPERAPRTPEGWRVQAGLLACGSSPCSAFPGRWPSGNLEKGSPPTVAGAAPELTAVHARPSHRIPFWPFNANGAP